MPGRGNFAIWNSAALVGTAAIRRPAGEAGHRVAGDAWLLLLALISGTFLCKIFHP